ncbi:glycerophosphodiester phosphodiesterase [Planococcus halotolerans]|uniref:Glycerophosphodiester phosphodiesterase n=1 Tax=Planococcus halotolerans TaxID=2233542 RepID=A0A365L661_9BACL|nr:glycerophosphodiester phosphodiesterase [Planococcus halotolerans]QHJ70409.1 glycerophosphodiester phosphodiesterase [Planococcus halotolerans]RAZ80865.1 glycerophosphodiester phosphodiesterase [Planococcus halotolerans]
MRIYAHRGCSGTYPENTLAAFKAAAELPITGVEIDVHLTKDREIVVIHDEKVNRTTDGKGYIKDMTLSEVRKLDAGSWFSGEFAGEKIPTLDEVFDIFQETDHRLNIELKTDVFPYEGLVGKVLEAAEKRGFLHRILISSFNHEDIQTVSRKKTVESAILTLDIYVDVYDYARVVGTDRIHMSLPGAFRRMATDALRRGAIVYAYTVNEIEYAQQLQQIGIHGIFTDFPELMLAELESPVNQ